MGDLKGSGAFEQNADNIWLLHREGYYDKRIEGNDAELIIDKARNAPTGIIKLKFLKDYVKFVEA